MYLSIKDLTERGSINIDLVREFKLGLPTFSTEWPELTPLTGQLNGKILSPSKNTLQTKLISNSQTQPCQLNQNPQR